MVNLFLLIVVIILLYIRFKEIWLTLFFTFIVFIVRYARKRLGIPMTFEPVILFSVVALRAFGFWHGVFVAVVSLFFADLLSGAFEMSSFVSILCKVLVLIPVHFFGKYNLYLVSLFSYIIFNEGVGTFLAVRTSKNITRILTQLLTSTVIRVVYLGLFLGWLCSVSGC